MHGFENLDSRQGDQTQSTSGICRNDVTVTQQQVVDAARDFSRRHDLTAVVERHQAAVITTHQHTAAIRAAHQEPARGRGQRAAPEPATLVIERNDDLPIPLDGHGGMEVDLLDADARIPIELDGAQHLDDADAYRRDRRKDQLLQEGGYVVLCFLAEDVGTDLAAVLDTILRTIASHARNWPGPESDPTPY